MNEFNDSFEQYNQAFWIRNNELNKDQNSKLTNQARLTNHIMSLDEVDISDEAIGKWNAKSPMSGQRIGELRGSRQKMFLNQMS